MSWRTNSALTRKLAALTGKNVLKKDDGVDELNSLLLQIVLAVMLIFMIAFFLFMNKVDGEISRIDEMRQRIAEAEQNEWNQALEKLTERYRIAYGLKEFLHIDPLSGEKSYDFSEMIADGRLVGKVPRQRAFRFGAAAAYRDYGMLPAELEKAWLDALSKLRGKPASGAQLREAVRERIQSLRREVVEVQSLAAAEIQRAFAAHPEQLDEPAVRAMLTRIDREQDGTAKKALMDELSRTLRRRAYAQLKTLCDAPMLEVE